MKPLNILGESHDSDGHRWELWERDGVFSIIQDGIPCASSFTHGSEDMMADVAIAPITRATQPIVMIAGLGLGYGMARVCQQLKREKAKVIIAEPVQAIIDWNRQYGENAPILRDDPRIDIECTTAVELCQKRTGSLHAILLKHTHARCQLSVQDAQAYFNALKGGSLLVIAIGKTDKRLEGILRRAGFEVSFTHVPASSKGKQMKLHTLILARRGRFVPFAQRGGGSDASDKS